MLIKFCVGCGKPHSKRGNFCETDCHKAYRIRKRDEKAEKQCRLCCRPGNPEEWARYRRWRKWEREQGALLVSEHTEVQESVAHV
jgi:hypothetical protein